MKKQIITDKNGFLNRKEISDKYSISLSDVGYYAKKYSWEKYYLNGDNRTILYSACEVSRTMIDIKPINAWDNIDLEWGETFIPINPILHFNGYERFFDMIKACKNDKYVITNYGRIFNLTYRKVISTDTKCTNGYIQSKLNGIIFTNHGLVAYFFCDNAKSKKEVHHIDGNKTNNHFDNLIYCTREEHARLHKLMKLKQWDKYYEYIEQIRADNKREEPIKVIAETNEDHSVYEYFSFIPQHIYQRALADDGTVDWDRISGINPNIVSENCMNDDGTVDWDRIRNHDLALHRINVNQLKAISNEQQRITKVESEESTE